MSERLDKLQEAMIGEKLSSRFHINRELLGDSKAMGIVQTTRLYQLIEGSRMLMNIVKREGVEPRVRQHAVNGLSRILDDLPEIVIETATLFLGPEGKWDDGDAATAKAALSKAIDVLELSLGEVNEGVAEMFNAVRNDPELRAEVGALGASMRAKFDTPFPDHETKIKP